MKILHLNASDTVGGAARAAYRLHHGLRDAGIDSRMLVQRKSTDEDAISGPRTALEKLCAVLRPRLDLVPLRGRRAPLRFGFSTGIVGRRASALLAEYDIAHLHWIGQGFLRIENLRALVKPVVWTLHDAWPFTGGCHYPGDCDAYRTRCGRCPALQSSAASDLSTWIWTRKRKTWAKLPLVVVAPSRWLAECARQSALLARTRVEVIANGIDTRRFAPVPRDVARSILGIPEEKRVIAFTAFGGASNPIKGFHLLREALQKLATIMDPCITQLLVVGASQVPVGDYGASVRCLGHLSDELSLRLVNSAADVVAVPSVQDNLANTVIEGLACARPVVAFDIGGMPDMIRDGYNGSLVPAFDTSAYAEGLFKAIADPGQRGRFAEAARHTAEAQFDIDLQVARYRDLYRDLCDVPRDPAA